MKLELIEWLTRLKDPGVLGSLLQWKKVNEVQDWYQDLTAEERASIDRGLAEAAEGMTMVSEEFWKHYSRQTED